MADIDDDIDIETEHVEESLAEHGRISRHDDILLEFCSYAEYGVLAVEADGLERIYPGFYGDSGYFVVIAAVLLYVFKNFLERVHMQPPYEKMNGKPYSPILIYSIL